MPRIRRYGTVERDLPYNQRFFAVSGEATRLFTLVKSQADDFGRYWGSPSKLRNHCYLAHDDDQETMPVEVVKRLLNECEKTGLFMPYHVEGVRYILIVDHVRGGECRAKFPPPPSGSRPPARVKLDGDLFRKGEIVPCGTKSCRSAGEKRDGNGTEKGRIKSARSVPDSGLSPSPSPSPSPSYTPSSRIPVARATLAPSPDRILTDGVCARGPMLSRSQRTEARTGFARSLGDGLSIGRLKDDRFVLETFRRAVAFGVVGNDERGRQNVFAAAEQTVIGGKTFGLFVHLLCDAKRKGITEQADERAAARVRRMNGMVPTRRYESAVDEALDCEEQ